MPHPLIVGGLIVGGALAAVRLARIGGRRLRTLAERVHLQRHASTRDPVCLEPDPDTGVYRPVEPGAGGRRRTGA